ncbi:hypothetical protein BKA70DRAFT_1420253 [Coprinopsis sp. MPI-PUGE-AT-0042]|nr:hypothetical protein BKA70DRAFT_1420253 [Coprinopsis sp. MPI-PUGE-AT-0042]
MLSKRPSDMSIADSEPERVQIRNLDVTKVAERRKVKSPVNPVIEISDSDSDPGTPKQEKFKMYSIPRERDTPVLTKTLSLAQFAFEAPPPSRPPRPKPPVASSLRAAPAGEIGDAPVKKTRTRKVVTEFLPEFSDKDVALVLKCVSCEARWTTRKTSAEKRRHIQSCARKNELTVETIQVLVRKEISKHLPPTPVEEPPAAPLLEPTLFETHNPAENAPKRRTKAAKAAVALVGVASNRDEILNRAQLILGMDQPAFPDTPPRATQGFAPSRLGGGAKGASLFRDYDDDIEGSSSRSISPGSRASLHLISHAGPSTSSNSSDESDSSGTISKKTKTKTKAKTKATPEKKRATPKPKARSKSPCKPTKRAPAWYSNKDWESSLRQKIEEDLQLKMRILRLEPISIDIFVDIVGGNCNKDNVSHKQRLSKFLDNEGILNFDPVSRW